MRFLLIFLLLTSTFFTIAQQKANLTIVPKFKEDNLQLDKAYVLENDSIKITNLKFYISNLKYYKNDSLIYTSNKKAHLIDLSKELSLQINEKKSFDFDKVKFNIGIDSLTNVSGIFEGDLDPANGMYWSWQSGYINFKLEGTSSLCPSRKNKFYWHIGGYSPPFNTLRQVALKTNEKVIIQLGELFEEIDVSVKYQVMSPNDNAVQIADKLPSLFKSNH